MRTTSKCIPLTPNNNKHLISPNSITLKHLCHKNAVNDPQLKKLLIVRQILLISTSENV